MGSFGLFITIMVVGAVLYFLLRGRSDTPKAVGQPKKVMSTAPIEPVTFKCPLSKCPVCAGSTDKMRQDWDGFRKITWVCGYCGNASIQELNDNERPLSAHHRPDSGRIMDVPPE